MNPQSLCSFPQLYRGVWNLSEHIISVFSPRLLHFCCSQQVILHQCAYNLFHHLYVAKNVNCCCFVLGKQNCKAAVYKLNQ